MFSVIQIGRCCFPLWMANVSPTKSGRIKRSKAYKSHILTKKSTKRLRGLRQTGYIAECEEKKIRKLIPYS